MATPVTPYRLTAVDLERVQQVRDRYRLESDTESVRLALKMALKQHVIMSDAQVKVMLGKH